MGVWLSQQAQHGKIMKARIQVTLKSGVLDPQGKAIEGALKGLGFQGVDGARQGKLIELSLAETDEATARAKVEEMCKKLLANPVMENYTIEFAR
jgi:phosphoribosylformylglycinamidine synthase